MKALMNVAVAMSVLAAPVVSHAQGNGSLTRSQVQAELIGIENAGYYPGRESENDYPTNIQAAEARASAPNGPASGWRGTDGGSIRRTSPAAPW